MSSGSTSPQPAISVVIPTRNRGDKVCTAIESVLANTHPTFDLLVVDQSREPSTELAVAPYRADPRFRYLRSDTIGAACARNVGVAHTTGEIIAFTDDDCTVEAGWLDSLSECFVRAPLLGAVAGAVVAAQGFDPAQGWLPTFSPTASTTVTGRNGMFLTGVMSANMAIRRDVFTKTGGFDLVMGAGAPLKSAEDIDIIYRILLAGHPVRIERSIRVTHFGYRDYRSGSGGRLLQETMLGNGAFFGKHIRCGDRFAARVYLRESLRTVRSVLANVLAGHRPVGVRRPLMLVVGLCAAFRHRVDRQHRLFVPTESEPTVNHSAEQTKLRCA